MTMKCRGCEAEIDFVKNKYTGKRIPVNLEYIRVVTDDGRVIRGRISHFATCPKAEQFRKNKKPKEQ